MGLSAFHYGNKIPKINSLEKGLFEPIGGEFSVQGCLASLFKACGEAEHLSGSMWRKNSPHGDSEMDKKQSDLYNTFDIPLKGMPSKDFTSSRPCFPRSLPPNMLGAGPSL